MIEYIFPNDPVAVGYCVFPQALEDDALVLFHATPIQNYAAIAAKGFKIPDPKGLVGLPSVSFAKRSVGALSHAMNRRKGQPGDYCIFAVRYATLQRAGIKVNLEDIHDYSLAPPPELIGYCIVPSSYEHV